MTEDAESPISETLRKSEETFYKTFVLGDTPNEDKIKEIVLSDSSTKTLLKAGLAILYNRLPDSFKAKLHEKAFENLPLDVPEIEGYRVFEKIGYGGMNSVYLLNSGRDKSFSIGLSRRSYKDTAEALKFAEYQKLEYGYFKNMYKDIPNLIPKESYVITERFDNSKSIMFIREFVPGPLKDIFEYPEEELKELLDQNKTLLNQLIKFTTISMENKNVVIGEQLDFLGANNLSIAGKPGEEQLYLMDPHTIIYKSSETELKIKNRLEYLNKIIKEIIEDNEMLVSYPKQEVQS